MSQKQVIVWVIVVVVAASGSFYAGTQYQKSQAPARSGFGQFAGGTSGTRGTRAGNGFAVGKVVSVSGSTLTIQLASGSSEIVLIGTSTPILKTSTGTPNDLSAGTNVVVMGTPNSDGSLTAQSIQIRPAGMTGGFGGGAGVSVPAAQ